MEPCAIVPLSAPVDALTATTPVAGAAPLVRVVRSVRGPIDEARIVVVATAEAAPAARNCLAAAGLDVVVVAVAVAIADRGGARRHLLAAGLAHLGIARDSPGPVLVGDLRHPLAPTAVAVRVLAALCAGGDVIVPTLAVTDTVKTVDGAGRVVNTVDRSTLHTVQFPRGFSASALWRLVSLDDDRDEFESAVRAGFHVGTVTGDPTAVEFQLPADGALLEAITASHPG